MVHRIGNLLRLYRHLHALFKGNIGKEKFWFIAMRLQRVQSDLGQVIWRCMVMITTTTQLFH